MSDMSSQFGPTGPVGTPDTSGVAAETATSNADAAGTESSVIGPVAPADTGHTIVQITKADLDALIALAATKNATSVAAVKAPVTRVTNSTALVPGDPITHNGHLAQVISVLTTPRDINGETWEQVLYHVGVFAEEHIVDAEAVGKVD